MGIMNLMEYRDLFRRMRDQNSDGGQLESYDFLIDPFAC